METPLTVNAAVASGWVVFAAVGDENRLEYTVIGETVNLAAKLEKHNKAERSLAITTLETLTAAKSQGYIPAREPDIRRAAAVAGAGEPLDLALWR